MSALGVTKLPEIFNRWAQDPSATAVLQPAKAETVPASEGSTPTTPQTAVPTLDLTGGPGTSATIQAVQTPGAASFPKIPEALTITQQAGVKAENQALLKNLAVRHPTTNPVARAFARHALWDTLTVSLGNDFPPVDKTEARARVTDTVMQMVSSLAKQHERILTQGLPEYAASDLSPEAYRAISQALLAEAADLVWSTVPVGQLLAQHLPVFNALFSVEDAETKQRAIALLDTTRFLNAISYFTNEKGMALSETEQETVALVTSLVDQDPPAAFAQLEPLIPQVLAFQEQLKAAEAEAAKAPTPPPDDPLLDEVFQNKEGPVAPPPLSPQELWAQAQTRKAELVAEIQGVGEPTMQQRYQGAMVGLAVADALGGPMEFMSRERIFQTYGMVTDMIGGGWLKLEPGEFTDDTQMAVAMAESITAQQGFDVEDVKEKFVAWLNTDPKDVGGLTRDALQLARNGSPALSAGLIPWSLSGFANAGNGSVMRGAPVALLTAFADDETLVATAHASSAVTHADPRCLWGMAAISKGVSLILQGEDHVTEKVAKFVGQNCPDLAQSLEQVALIKDPQELRTSGFVIHTVQAAFWALENATDFVDGALTLINLGEDTDTAGATGGILLGARFGVDGIPPSWRNTLQKTDQLTGLADQIQTLAAPTGVAQE